jgi:hypothetical protein
MLIKRGFHIAADHLRLGVVVRVVLSRGAAEIVPAFLGLNL